jgi:IMP cyclohydrolase
MTADGVASAVAYFIMGRSVNSRNRVFVERDGAIFTAPIDAKKVSDPSLIIYPALIACGATTIVTNGTQTDAIVDGLAAGRSFETVLRGWKYEPDFPHFTQRISALVTHGAYRLAILRKLHDATMRAFWECDGQPGVGHLIHTYAGDGDPLPPFRGDPVEVAVGDDQDAWTAEIWSGLNAANRIALLTRFIYLDGRAATTRIINGRLL